MTTPDLSTLAILGLATYRLARFSVLETGPFRIMEHVREGFPESELLHCMHCIGVYLAILIVILWANGLGMPIVVLAVAGVVSLIRDMAMR